MKGETCRVLLFFAAAVIIPVISLFEVERMEVMPGRVDRAFERHRQEYERKMLEILRSGQYIMGEELAAFENAFAAYLNVPFCVGLASGLDALRISLRALGVGKGDEVIVQGNSFIADVMAIVDNGAIPVFIEPNGQFNMEASAIAAAVTPRTKAVLVTHLYGMPTPMDDIVRLCEARELKLVEDCAHAHGAQWRGKKVGTFGDAGCFSFYPTKNLGGFGDGGAVTVRSPAVAEKIRVIRNYGSEKKYRNKMIGANSRLDALQAGLLRVRLQYLDEMNAEREAIARRYAAEINNPLITLPVWIPNAKAVWHQYVVRCQRRDELQAFLLRRQIHTLIHYPVPPHRSEAFAYLGMGEGSLPQTEALAKEVLSLPMYNGMLPEEQSCVIAALNDFC